MKGKNCGQVKLSKTFKYENEEGAIIDFLFFRKKNLNLPDLTKLKKLKKNFKTGSAYPAINMQSNYTNSTTQLTCQKTGSPSISNKISMTGMANSKSSTSQITKWEETYYAIDSDN